MKTLFSLVICLIVSVNLIAQNYNATKGEISFYSKAPLEDIEAVSSYVISIINIKTKKIVVITKITAFKFDNSLMQEHFNENYLESEKYPDAQFSGTIQEDIDFTKAGTYPISAMGPLTIHGVAKQRILKGTLTVSPDNLKLVASLEVILEEHNIKIPTVVSQKIAEKVEVKTNFTFTPYQEKKK